MRLRYWQDLSLPLNCWRPMLETIRKGFPMPKHVFAAAVAAAAIAMPAFAAQTDPDVNKLPAGPGKANLPEGGHGRPWLCRNVYCGFDFARTGATPPTIL